MKTTLSIRPSVAGNAVQKSISLFALPNNLLLLLLIILLLPSVAGAQNFLQMIKQVENDRENGSSTSRTVNDNFGYSVAISGDYAVVGAYQEDEDAAGINTVSNAGSAFIFVRSGSTWTLQQKIVASERATNDNFGRSVAISGDYIVVGAYLEDEDAAGINTLTNAGSAYIFVRSGSIWSQQQKIVASDRAVNDNFGCSVAISGDYAIAGAYNEDEDAAGANTLNNSGSAYIFVRSGSTWSEQQKIIASDRAVNDNFGYSVAISGDYVIAGAYQEDEDAAGANTRNASGSAYIFVRSGSTWSQQQKIVASDRAANDNFGNSVSISGPYAISGAYLEDEDASGFNTFNSAGSSYIFNFNGSTWFQQQKVVALDRAASDNFGYSVAISGNYAVVGAHLEDEDASGINSLSAAGAAYIFYRNSGIWTFQQKIVASDRAVNDNFGNSVAISGDYVIVGAANEDEDATGSNTISSAGSAYIFVRSGSTWSQQQKIVASSRGNTDNFGNAVAISGDYVVVGAYQEDEDATENNTIASSGSAYIFVRSGSTWSQQQKIVSSNRSAGFNFGFSVSISGDYVIVGSLYDNLDAAGANTLNGAGAAFVFVRSGSTWSQQQKIVASDRGGDDSFGYAVAISGDYAAVGAYSEDEDASGANTLNNSGSAYIFVRSGSTWSQQQKIVASDRGADDLFGFAVAISGDYATVGAYSEDEDASGANTLSNSGSAYIFKRSGSTWSQQQKIVASDRAANDNFGYSVAISGGYVVAGAFNEDEDAAGTNLLSNAGSVYLFESTSTLPVTITSIKAFEKNQGIQVEWNVANEQGIASYEVERSTDGSRFTRTASLAAMNTAAYTYAWLDQNPINGNNYYRVKIISVDGDIKYTAIVKVNISGVKASLVIYPNPVRENSISLQLNNLEKGNYVVDIINAAGQVVERKSISHPGGSATQTIPFRVQSGSYRLKISKPSVSFIVPLIKL